MTGGRRSILRLLLLASALTPRAFLHADGGTMRLSERKGGYQISVFTSPTPVRAGSVDVSVLIEDAATGEPIPEARVTVRAMPHEHPEEIVCRAATSEAATNKLFLAAVFDLAEPGWWDVEIVLEGLREPAAVRFEMEVGEPPPHGWEIAPWIAWPVLAVLLFGVHQFLVRRQSTVSPGATKRASPHE